ncbi:MAG: hypothetical protein LBJ24_09275, partial [Treponema sp.]|nr:hypothetical protein [Treponema sp.]
MPVNHKPISVALGVYCALRPKPQKPPAGRFFTPPSPEGAHKPRGFSAQGDAKTCEYSRLPGTGGAAEASLYIHIPFCAGACDYCDFYSTAPRGGQRDRLTGAFIEALLLDAERTLAGFARSGGGPLREPFPKGPVFRTEPSFRVPAIYIGG